MTRGCVVDFIMISVEFKFLFISYRRDLEIFVTDNQLFKRFLTKRKNILLCNRIRYTKSTFANIKNQHISVLDFPGVLPQNIKPITYPGVYNYITAGTTDQG